MVFPLTEEQNRVVEHAGSALLVSAAAGSGKTRVLVERLLRSVERGADIDRFLVITFTKAAAAELRGRIGAELTARLAEEPGNAHLRRQSLRLYQAKICTIDALCIDLLREYGNLLDISPDFRICDSAEEEEMKQDILEDLLEDCYREMDAGYKDFGALAEYTVRGRDDGRLKKMVRDIHAKLQSCEDPDRWLEEHRRDLEAEGITDAGDTVWGRVILERVHARAAYWRRQMEACYSTLESAGAGGRPEEGSYRWSLAGTIQDLEMLENAKGWDQMRACLPVRFGKIKGGKRKAGDPEGDPTIMDPIRKKREKCKKATARMNDLISDGSDESTEEIRALAPIVETLLDLVGRFGRLLLQEKRRRNVLGFSDTEHLAVRLLEQEPLQKMLREQFAEIMVDEYQDTNEVQDTLFRAMSRGGNNLFFVGDIKQSIYRFRNADPTIFLAKYRNWADPDEPGDWEGRKLLLSYNFRSRSQVLSAVNDVFMQIMSVECGEMEYGEEEKLAWLEEIQPNESCSVEMDVLDIPRREKGEDAVSSDLLEARFTARRLAQMLHEKFQVSDGKGGLRDMKAGDAVILMRSPGPVLKYYIRALNEEGIPVDAEEDEDFFETTEISVALALLQAIDNPHRDIPLISLLRSPLFRFSSDRLAEIRSGCRQGDFYDALVQDGGEDCADFLERLERLRFRAGEMSVYRLLERIYREMNLTAIFGAMPDGGQRQANLGALADQARMLEESGHRGLFAFLRHVESLREEGVSLNVAQSAGGVKILSIHKSKGLEFPVVFLCRLNAQFNTEDLKEPMLFHPRLGVGPKRRARGKGWTVEWSTMARKAVQLSLERESKAEEMRLLYVAMTRARDKLIMTMHISNARSTLDSLSVEAGNPPDPEAVADRRSMGEWLLLTAMTRPEAGELRGETGCFVDPDERGPAWDIRLLDGSQYREDRHGYPESDTEEETTDEARVLELEKALGYRYPHPDAAQLPSKVTATQLKGRYLDSEAAEDTDLPGQEERYDFARPDFAAGDLGLTATQRGTATHKVLQYMSFQRTGSAEEISREIRRLELEWYITPYEAESVDPQQLYTFFSSELGQQILSSPRCHREYKFSLLLPAGEVFPNAEVDSDDQVLLQGIVDCWFEEKDGITVVDFKTDRIPDPEQYRDQVESYAKALEVLTGKPVRHKILYFFSAGKPFFL